MNSVGANFDSSWKDVSRRNQFSPRVSNVLHFHFGDHGWFLYHRRSIFGENCAKCLKYCSGKYGGFMCTKPRSTIYHFTRRCCKLPPESWCLPLRISCPFDSIEKTLVANLALSLKRACVCEKKSHGQHTKSLSLRASTSIRLKCINSWELWNHCFCGYIEWMKVEGMLSESSWQPVAHYTSNIFFSNVM